MSNLHLSKNVIMHPDCYIVLLIDVSLPVGLVFLSTFSDEGLLLKTSVELVFVVLVFSSATVTHPRFSGEFLCALHRLCFLHRLPTPHTYLHKFEWLGLNAKSAITKI